MFVRVLLFSLIFYSCVFAGELSLTDSQKSELLSIYRIEFDDVAAYKDNKPPTIGAMLRAFAKKEKLTLAQIVAFNLQLLDDIFRKQKYDDEYMAKNDALMIISSFAEVNLGKKITEKLLKDLIHQDFMGVSRAEGLFTYMQLFADTLLDDPYIETEMTTAGDFTSKERYIMIYHLIKKYPQAIATEQRKIIDKFYRWVQLDCNASQSCTMDELLVEHKPEYRQSPERKKILQQGIDWLEKNNRPRECMMYRRFSAALANWDKQGGFKF